MFEVNRCYNELVERLDIERVNDIVYLPCKIFSSSNDDKVDHVDYLPGDVTGIAADDNNDEIIIDLIVRNHTQGDLTILDGDKLYDVIIWNNPVDILEKYDNLSSLYIVGDNIVNLIKNELCRHKTRLLYDDGG